MDACEVLLVGAGLTSAAVAARLRVTRPDLRIMAIDTRPHLAGNCFDETADRGTRIHRYGPHLFHSKSPRIVGFLSDYTAWTAVHHAVTAEVDFDGRLQQVPFPYCGRTAAALGRDLDVAEVTDLFFRGYSQKMWGRPWDDLPMSVRSRVPTKDTVVTDAPSYFPGQFVAMPRDGYTSMIQRMYEGCELRLNAEPIDWLSIRATQVVYTGRPDLLPDPASPTGRSLGETHSLELSFRTLDLRFSEQPNWQPPTSVLNLCHEGVSYTRQTCYRLLTGGSSNVISTEYPRDAMAGELAPFYPVLYDSVRLRFAALKQVVHQCYPELILAGRLGVFQYLDMDQAVGQGIAVAEKLAAKL